MTKDDVKKLIDVWIRETMTEPEKNKYQFPYSEGWAMACYSLMGKLDDWMKKND